MNYNKVKNKLEYKTISEQINENTKYNAIELFPFETRKTNIYNSIDDMINIVKDECSKESKKYIYVYDIEPDHTMHDYGPDSNEVVTLIKEREEKIKKLCDNLKDSIVFITADHGHKLVEPIFLKNYPELYEMLERTTSIEQRSVSFKIKDGFKEMFKNKFVQLFGEDFKLYEKQEVINSNLFGNGKQHELFEDAIGDFVAYH